MEGIQQKVYLFKAAPEEDCCDTTNNTSLHLQPNHLQQQQQKGTLVEQQQITKDDTKISTQQQGETTTTTSVNNNVVTANSSKDRFITLLNSLKIENQLVSVLVFEYANLDSLWGHLKQPDEHAGIVLTSPRCVYSIKEAIKAHDRSSSQNCSSGEWENELRKKWESKFVFCVGPSTVSTARQLLPSLKTELVITGLESHAESLANKMIEVNSKAAFKAQLLYPCGAQRRDVLLNKLSGEGIACSQCTVYQSVKNPTLETTLHFVAEELKDLHDHSQMETILCFFSPSGVNYVFQYLDPTIVEHNHANIVAIGPTTKTALEDFFTKKGINKQIYQSKSPTPESLIDVLDSIRTRS